LDFEATIEATLLDLSYRFRVCKILFDPYQMQATAQRLLRAGLPIEEFPQTPANLTSASQALFDSVQSGGLTVYPDQAMRLAISRAVAVETPRGWRISKQTASHKVDVVVALAMACYAAIQAQADPAGLAFFDPYYGSPPPSFSNDPKCRQQKIDDDFQADRLKTHLLRAGMPWGLH
jgi:phage terminase large subunit-like protein